MHELIKILLSYLNLEEFNVFGIAHPALCMKPCGNKRMCPIVPRFPRLASVSIDNLISVGLSG